MWLHVQYVLSRCNMLSFRMDLSSKFRKYTTDN